MPIFSAKSQNQVFDGSETINYGSLNLSSISTGPNWITTLNAISGKFSNYGAASFNNAGSVITVNSITSCWVNGYVKHYATAGNTSHVYPVGSNSERQFLSTTNEIANYHFATAWIPGNPTTNNDPTGPNSGTHSTSSKTSPILSVSTIGQWDWVTNYTGTSSVTISVKIPSSIVGNSNLRLVGWNGTSWINLGSQGDTGGVLTGLVPAGITALGIGSVASGLSKTILVEPKSTFSKKPVNSEITYFKVYPNPTNAGKVTFEYDINYIGNGKLSLFNVSGSMVFKQELNIIKGNNTTSISVDSLAKGVYLIKLTDSNDSLLIEGKKLIIE